MSICLLVYEAAAVAWLGEGLLARRRTGSEKPGGERIVSDGPGLGPRGLVWARTSVVMGDNIADLTVNRHVLLP